MTRKSCKTQRFVLGLTITIGFSFLIIYISYFQDQGAQEHWLFNRQSLRTNSSVATALCRQHNAPQLGYNISFNNVGVLRKHSHFVYIRVEKTGSTVVRTLLYTFAMRHGLNMMRTGPGENDLMSTSDEARGKFWQIGPRQTGPPDMMSEHGWYNESFFKKHFPNDTVYLASVRNPLSWFKSFVNFMAFYRQRSMTAHQVLADGSIFNLASGSYMSSRCTNIKKMNRNRQLQWLGFDAVRDSNNVTAIRNYINLISTRFKLILVNEYFDESLLLLRRLMNWSFSDIFYKSYNVGKKNGSDSFSKEEEEKLIDINHNLGDWLLYQYSNKTLWQNIESQPNFSEEVKSQPNFYEELTDFRRENLRVYSWCHRKPNFPGERLIISTKWEPTFEIASGDCLRMTTVADIKFYHNLDIPTFEDVADQYSQIFN